MVYLIGPMDLIGPGIGAMVVITAGAVKWIITSTRETAGTETGVSSLGRSLDAVREETAKRLDTHDDEILDLRTNYVSRREFDDRMASSLAAINANYENIKQQLITQGRWLEYAVFNKKADEPRLFTPGTDRNS